MAIDLPQMPKCYTYLIDQPRVLTYNYIIHSTHINTVFHNLKIFGCNNPTSPGCHAEYPKSFYLRLNHDEEHYTPWTIHISATDDTDRHCARKACIHYREKWWLRK